MSVRISTKIWESNLSKNDMLVMLALADCADDDGYAYPKTTYLAWKTGLVRQTVTYILTDFRQKQYLIGNPSKGDESTRYQIAVHNLPAKESWAKLKGRKAGDSGRETLSKIATGSDPVKTGVVPCQNHEGTLSQSRSRNKEETSVNRQEPSVVASSLRSEELEMATPELEAKSKPISVPADQPCRETVYAPPGQEFKPNPFAKMKAPKKSRDEKRQEKIEAKSGTDPRWKPFKDEIARVHHVYSKGPCVWDGGESAQLARILRRYPRLQLDDFSQWLTNYWKSDNRHHTGATVFYLAKIEQFMLGSRDCFNKLQVPSGPEAAKKLASLTDIVRQQLGQK